MTRTRPIDYAGAAGRLSLADVRELGPRWVVQPKIDGVYARVHLDQRGRIAQLYSRAARPFPRLLVSDLMGACIGLPGSELVGELEAHTEAGNRSAASRGWRALHLFDAIRIGGRYLGREPYSVRRDALWRAQSEVECYGARLPWCEDDHGARSRSTGRFCRPVPTDWRVAPIIDQRPTCRVAEAWADWVERSDGEGLVVVNLDAPLGARGAKRKVKPSETLDAVVLSSDGRAASLLWAGRRFAVSAAGLVLERGQMVEVRCEGFYEGTSAPRFARIVRTRPDLDGTLVM
jgi:ATP-dependent DNA ligase